MTDKTINSLCIVANSLLYPGYLNEMKKADYLIAADAASLWLIRHGLTPNLAIGDFDSVNSEDLNLLKKRIPDTRLFPASKDYTDLHLAVKEALNINPQNVIIFGATGNRLDHFLGNVSFLELFLKKNIPAKIVDRNNEIYMCNSGIKLEKSSRFPYLSIIPYSSEAVVSIRGVLYEIKNKKIKKGQTI